MIAYKAHEAGFLPSQGGLDQQPALLLPIMATISFAVQEEQELARVDKDKNKAFMDASNANMQGSQSTNANGFAKIPPAKKG